jgi:hypothetical protein
VARAARGPRCSGPLWGEDADRVRAAGSGYPQRVETFFTALLVLVTLLVVWFAGYVVYRVYSDGQR